MAWVVDLSHLPLPPLPHHLVLVAAHRMMDESGVVDLSHLPLPPLPHHQVLVAAHRMMDEWRGWWTCLTYL